MDKLKTGLLIVWLVILGLLVLISYVKSNKTTEGYTPYGYYKGYCQGCGNKSRKQCANCTNCGYCVTSDGYGSCVPGDNYGPFFRKDCAQWKYSDPYSHYPRTKIFPGKNSSNVYPHYWWGNLRKSQWGFRDRNYSDYIKRLRKIAKQNMNLRNRVKSSKM